MKPALSEYVKELDRIVIAEPRRAFSKSSEKRLTLAEVFGGSRDAAWDPLRPPTIRSTLAAVYGEPTASPPKRTFFQEQVVSEMERFDRTQAEVRLGDLGRKYELVLPPAGVQRVKELVELRHSISHRLLTPGAVTTVSPVDLKDARSLFRQLPKSLLDQAKTRYPDAGLFDP